MPFWNKIDEKWKDQLHCPLHARVIIWSHNWDMRSSPIFSEITDGTHACMIIWSLIEWNASILDVQLYFFGKAKEDFGLFNGCWVISIQNFGLRQVISNYWWWGGIWCGGNGETDNELMANLSNVVASRLDREGLFKDGLLCYPSFWVRLDLLSF